MAEAHRIDEERATLVHFVKWALQICEGPLLLNDEQLRRHLARRAKEVLAEAGHGD